MSDLTFMDQAECVTDMHLDLWTTGTGRGPSNERARAICDQCPVKQDCTDWAYSLVGTDHQLDAQICGDYESHLMRTATDKYSYQYVILDRRTMAHECAGCGQVFTLSAMPTKPEGLFCSVECGQGESAADPVVCGICGDSFTPRMHTQWACSKHSRSEKKRAADQRRRAQGERKEAVA